MTGRVDFVASEQHLLDHLLPVIEAMPPGTVGQVHVTRPGADPARVTAGTVSTLLPDKTGGPLVGCQWGDIARYRHNRRVGLMEHGAGATYPDPNPAFAGGSQREDVALFLAPNQHVHDANAAVYPGTPNVVVGTPYLDPWCSGARPRPDPSEKVVVFSWHWDMTRWPGGRSALDHYAPGLRVVREQLEADGWVVLGTAHPRAWHKAPHAAAVYDRAGITPVHDFAAVLDVATVMVCDVSSSAWLSAAVGVAQVVCDAPWYAKAYADEVWPRFVLPLGWPVRDAEGIVGAVEAAHGEWPTCNDFTASVDEVVPYRDGRCAQRAAAAIVEHLL